jgi:hypothetical protein
MHVHIPQCTSCFWLSPPNIDFHIAALRQDDFGWRQLGLGCSTSANKNKQHVPKQVVRVCEVTLLHLSITKPINNLHCTLR